MVNMWKYITRNVRETFERRICSSLTDSSGQDKSPTCKLTGKFLPTIHKFCEKASIPNEECKFAASEEKREEKGQESSWNNTYIRHSWLGALGWSTAIVISWNLLQPLCRLQFSHNTDRKGPWSRNHTSAAHWRGPRGCHWKRDYSFNSKFARWPFACHRTHKHTDETDGVWDSGHHSLEDKGKKRKKISKQAEDDTDSGNHSLEHKHSSILQAYSVPSHTHDSTYAGFWKLLTQTVWAQPTRIIPRPTKLEIDQKPVTEKVTNIKYGPPTAEQALNDAAEKFAEAQNSLMGDIDNKLGVELMQKGRHHEAVSRFAKAVDFSNASAAYNLGVCYEMGLGTTQDFKKAAKYYQLASNKGHSTAMYNLGVFHIHGWGGLASDSNEAHRLFEKASSLGQSEAKKALEMIKVEELPPVAAEDATDNSHDIVQQALGLVQDLGLGFSQDGSQSGKISINSTADHKDISELVHDSILKYTDMLQK